jgi:hypothetical protein
MYLDLLFLLHTIHGIMYVHYFAVSNAIHSMNNFCRGGCGDSEVDDDIWVVLHTCMLHAQNDQCCGLTHQCLSHDEMGLGI